MAINIREGAAEDAVRVLAAKLGVGLTDAIHIAASNELKRLAETVPLKDRVKALRDTLRATPQVGEPGVADKAFYDALFGE